MTYVAPAYSFIFSINFMTKEQRYTDALYIIHYTHVVHIIYLNKVIILNIQPFLPETFPHYATLWIRTKESTLTPQKRISRQSTEHQNHLNEIKKYGNEVKLGYTSWLRIPLVCLSKSHKIYTVGKKKVYIHGVWTQPVMLEFPLVWNHLTPCWFILSLRRCQLSTTSLNLVLIN